MPKATNRLLLSGLVLLGTLEVTGRVLLGSDSLFALIASDDEISSARRWVRAHPGGATVVAHPFDDYDPLTGWRPKPGFRSTAAWGGERLSINSRGLRGQGEIPYARQPGVGRLLLLGDSFTFGEEVGDEDVFAHRLWELLPGIEIVNLAVHGYGHDQMLLRYRQEGARYGADLVALGFTPYDISRNLSGFRDYAKPRFVLERGELRLTGVPVPTPSQILDAAAAPRSRGVDLVRMAAYPLRRWLHSRRLLEALSDRFVEDVRRTGAEPMFFDLPTGQTLRPDGWKKRFVQEYCRARGLRCVLLRPYVLEQIERGVPFATGRRHWDAQGHRVVAQGLYEGLLAQGVVRCSAAAGEKRCALSVRLPADSPSARREAAGASRR